MKKLRIWKLLLLGLLLCALCMALSGCIVDPDKNAIPTSTFKKFTPIPDAPTDMPEVVTPTPDPNLNQQSWTTNTPDPNATAYVGSVTPVPGTLLGGVTATPSTAPGTTASTNAVLKRGSQGDAVKNVQEALRRLGYFEGKADGDFGEYTENAVKRFQAQNGLKADGVVGSATLAKLSSSSAKTAPPKGTATPKPTNKPHTNVYLAQGSSGANVSQMQNRLIQLGYLYGSASGKVCAITESAITAFQRRNGLDADGVAGPGTLEKMYANSAKKASAAVGIIGVTLKKGDEGAAVRLLQNELRSFGFLKSAADGFLWRGHGNGGKELPVRQRPHCRRQGRAQHAAQAVYRQREPLHQDRRAQAHRYPQGDGQAYRHPQGDGQAHRYPQHVCARNRRPQRHLLHPGKGDDGRAGEEAAAGAQERRLL